MSDFLKSVRSSPFLNHPGWSWENKVFDDLADQYRKGPIGNPSTAQLADRLKKLLNQYDRFRIASWTVYEIGDSGVEAQMTFFGLDRKWGWRMAASALREPNREIDDKLEELVGRILRRAYGPAQAAHPQEVANELANWFGVPAGLMRDELRKSGFLRCHDPETRHLPKRDTLVFPLPLGSEPMPPKSDMGKVPTEKNGNGSLTSPIGADKVSAMSNTTSTPSPLHTELNQKSLRDFINPLAKSLGGAPLDIVRRHDPEAGHWTNCKRTDIVASLIEAHGEARVREHMAKIAEAPKAAAAAPNGDAAAQLAAAVQAIAAGAKGVDEDAVRSIVEQAMTIERERIVAEAAAAARAASVLTVTVQTANAEPVACGVQHARFPVLVKMASARLGNGRRVNCWLHGPAGTGKTSAARAVAKALNLPFYFSGAIETAYALLGYSDAYGRLVRTPFRDAWEKGGVFLMDEADASHPQALCALNAAIDGSVAAFPDGMIERHPDCIIIAGANTAGRGGNAKYAGRVRQDEAFLSRWSLLEWPHDDRLEDHLAGDDEHATAWKATVRRYRRAAAEQRIEGASTTTRATLDGVALLRAGLEVADVLEATIRKGMPEESWKRLQEAAR